MAMDTDSNADEDGAEESRDGPSPGRTLDDATATATATAALSCAPVHAVSAPCSPTGTRPAAGPGPGPGSGSGSGLDLSASVQKASERPSSLPPSSPRALSNSDWAYHSTACPAERQNPGMHKDKGIMAELYWSHAECGGEVGGRGGQQTNDRTRGCRWLHYLLLCGIKATLLYFLGCIQKTLAT